MITYGRLILGMLWMLAVTASMWAVLILGV